MNTLKTLGLCLGVCSLLVLITGSSAFSMAETERPSSVTVTDDPDAYVGIDDCTLRNNLPITITAEFTGDAGSKSLEIGSEDIKGFELGDIGTGEQTLTLDPGEQGEITVGGSTTIRVTGDGISANLQRELECARTRVITDGNRTYEFNTLNPGASLGDRLEKLTNAANRTDSQASGQTGNGDED